MKKSVIVIVLAGLVAIGLSIKCGLKRDASSRDEAPAAQAQAPSPEQLSLASPEPRAAATEAPPESPSGPTNGLIALRLNPSLSDHLPSPEDAKKALAMNEAFLKTNNN